METQRYEHGRKMRLPILALFLLLLISSGKVSGQESSLFTQYKFHRLNEDNGLINNIVNDIKQDTLGYIWVATEGGVARYLGNNFHMFKMDRNDDGSIPHNLVNELFVDPENQVWMLTEGGVAKYNYQTDDVVRFRPQTLQGTFSSMAMNKAGEYFFGRYNGGIWRGNEAPKMMELIDAATGIDLSHASVTDIIINDGILWAGFWAEGVIRYDLHTNLMDYYSFHDVIDEETIKCYDLQLDQHKNLWVASNRGLFVLPENGTIPIKATKVSSGIFPMDDYLTIFEDKSKHLWLGTRQHGMFSFRFSDHKIVDIRHFVTEDDNSGISHRTVSKIFQDESGLIWLGTHNGGINVFKPEGEDVRFFTHQLNNPNSLSYKNVWGIAESNNGDIWVGTDGKGLNKLNPSTGSIVQPGWSELRNTAILCLLEDRQDRLWVGTYEHGMLMINLQTGTIRNFTRDSDHSDLMVNDIRVVHECEDGSILIGTNFGGLYSYDEKEHAVRLMNGSEKLDVRTIESKGNQLFLGTFNVGLVTCDLNNATHTYESLDLSEDKPRYVITSTCRTGDTIWIATRENGLLSYRIRPGQPGEFSETGILNNTSISGVCADQTGRIWLTTNMGLFAYESRKNTTKLFNHLDGMQHGHFNYGSIFSSRDGYMVAGGIKGMNLFYPDRLMEKTSQPAIVFDEIKILNEKMTPVNSRIFPSKESIFLTGKIHLNYDDNVFTLSYSTPGFNISKPNQFRYMLEGYDHDWQQSNESNQITYKNVPPGSYTFRIGNNDNVSKALTIDIDRPWWSTWQAYLIFLLLIAFALWRFIKFYNVRIALRQQLKFEKELREKDHLNMQEKLRFYTNFSHELKTPLTLIQGPVNDLIRACDDPKQAQYLQLIRKNTNILLKFIGRMLEFRKIEMSKTLLNVGCHDLKILAQEEAESFEYLAREKNLKFGFYCESDMEVWVDIEKIQIVMNNLLSNAFKFCYEGGAVNFGVFHGGDHLVIEVKDQGIGIEADDLKEIFSPFFQAKNATVAGGTGIGLALSKSFVELHGGSITVDSRPNRGSTFKVCLPTGKKHLLDKPYIRFIQVVTEAIESDLINRYQRETASDGITDADTVIMVVDDNRDISLYIRTLFDGNYKVIESDNAKDALSKAIKNIPDIVITDLMMPGMNGIELCRTLKENIATSHIPVIMLTAKNSSKSKLEGFQVGADDYITKPFNSDLLIARVRNLLDNRKLLELRYGVNDLIDPQSTEDSREAEFILKAEAIILGKLQQANFNVPDLCKALGMSQTSLYRKIKSITGVSIQLFIRKIKIKRAAQLLVSDDLTVTEIAFFLDFSDLKYFRKCFKEQFKMTPSKYKETCISTGQPKTWPEYSIRRNS